MTTSTLEVATSTSALVQTWDATGARILQADPELLYSVRTGDGVGEFGMEECRECDPARPWAPIVDSQNRILVADTVNRRWLLIDVATVTSVPFPGDEVVVGLGLGPNDIVYVVYSATDVERVVAYESSNMNTPLRSTPVAAPLFSRLTFDGDALVVNGRSVPLVSGRSLSPGVVPAFDESPPSLTVLYENGQQAHWMLNVLQSPIGPIGLENQSVFVEGVDDASSAAPQFVGYELTSDGTAVGVQVPGGSDALNGGLFVDERGIVRLRHDMDADLWLIERFPLPSALNS